MSDNAPFYNKGKGRSIMCSDLLVMRPSGPFFSLTNKEYSEALKKYPNRNDDCDINYEKIVLLLQSMLVVIIILTMKIF